MSRRPQSNAARRRAEKVQARQDRQRKLDERMLERVMLLHRQPGAARAPGLVIWSGTLPAEPLFDPRFPTATVRGDW